jgi:hypothetical protein
VYYEDKFVRGDDNEDGTITYEEMLKVYNRDHASGSAWE